MCVARGSVVMAAHPCNRRIESPLEILDDLLEQDLVAKLVRVAEARVEICLKFVAAPCKGFVIERLGSDQRARDLAVGMDRAHVGSQVTRIPAGRNRE